MTATTSHAALLHALPHGTERALVALARHRLLDTSQIRRLCYPTTHPSWTRTILRAATKAGYVKAVPRRLAADDRGRPTNMPAVWAATIRGCEAASEVAGEDFQPIPAITQGRPPTWTQAHTLAINEVGVLLVQHLPSYDVRWKNEVQHPVRRARPWRYVRPDALIAIEGTRPDSLAPVVQTYFLELDRASSPVLGTPAEAGLVDKVTAYASFAASNLWHENYPPDDRLPANGLPALWIVLDGSPSQAARRRDQLIAALSDERRTPIDPDLLWVLVSTLPDLKALGPLGPHAHYLTGHHGNIFATETD